MSNRAFAVGCVSNRAFAVGCVRQGHHLPADRMRVRAVLASVRSGSPVDASLSAGGGSGATDAVCEGRLCYVH